MNIITKEDLIDMGFRDESLYKNIQHHYLLKKGLIEVLFDRELDLKPDVTISGIDLEIDLKDLKKLVNILDKCLKL